MSSSSTEPPLIRGHSSISVRTETKIRLKKMKRSRETWDDVLNRLADSEGEQ